MQSFKLHKITNNERLQPQNRFYTHRLTFTPRLTSISGMLNLLDDGSLFGELVRFGRKFSLFR